MGRKLATRIPKEFPDSNIDVIVPVPDSGRIAAMELAKDLGIPFREGFVKNRYVGRTFIMPGQAIRKDSVRKKRIQSLTNLRGKTYYWSTTVSSEETPVPKLFKWRETLEPASSSPVQQPCNPSKRVWNRHACQG